MLDRVVMHVIQMRGVVPLIPDNMLPEASLPEAAFTACLAHL